MSLHLLLIAVVGLAAILLTYAVLTYGTMTEMQQVYLRDRAAGIAARLETLSRAQLTHQARETIVFDDNALVDLRLYRIDRPEDHPPELEPIWTGKELFRTGEVKVGTQKLFRAYIPFHSESLMHIARIDLSLSANEFLLVYARRNLLVAAFSGLSLLVLALWAVWSAQKTARFQTRELQLEHLAHLGQMSAVLAHEIRNPLGVIKGFTQLACEKAGQDVVALLTPVLNEIRRIEKLVLDLLLYSKPCKPVIQTVAWRSLAADLERFAREAIGQGPTRFLCEPEDWRFESDPDLLKEALLNLIRNSVEALAAEPEGCVQLSATARDGGLAIAVEDNGPGIAKEVGKRLFEPFLTTKASGTGLGLSVARKLARSLGGELQLRPVEPHGTRAELLFSGIRTWNGS
jgi:signal transduction histidine kinase